MELKSRYTKDIIDYPSLLHLAFANIDKFRDKPLYIDGATDRRVTFGQVRDQIRRFGSYLIRNGFQKGDILAIYSPNTIEYASVFLGAIYAGGAITTCNPLYTVRELAHQLTITNAKYIVTIAEFANNVQELSKTVKFKKRFVLGNFDGFISLRAILEDKQSPIEPQIDVDREDVGVIPFSSGTTGLAKGVCLTHRNVVWATQINSCPDLLVLDESQTILAVLPFYHIFGMSVTMLLPICNGITTILMVRFDPQVFLSCVQKYKVTFTSLVPPLVLFFAKHPMVDKYDTSSLKRCSCGAAPLSKEIQEAAQSRLNIKILQGYGMTETSSCCFLNPVSNIKIGSCGRIVPCGICKVVDVNTGEALGPYKEGEILTKGPHIMKCYLKDAKATMQTIDKDGWLHTGDIGYYDNEEYFFVVDRRKELIKYKGFQVAPAELEALLMSHEKVLDAAVIGINDEECGELPKAFVVSSGNATAEELIKFVNSKVSPQKRLRGGIQFIDKIPKSGSGKVLRRVLKNMQIPKSKY